MIGSSDAGTTDSAKREALVVGFSMLWSELLRALHAGMDEEGDKERVRERLTEAAALMYHYKADLEHALSPEVFGQVAAAADFSGLDMMNHIMHTEGTEAAVRFLLDRRTEPEVD